MSLFYNEILFTLPELTFITLIGALLGIAVINKDIYSPQHKLLLSLTDLSILSLLGLVVLYASKRSDMLGQGSNLLLSSTLLNNSTKLLTLIIAVLVFIVARSYFQHKKLSIFELPLIMLSSLLGIILVMGSNDLFMLYLVFELQSLSIYALVTAYVRSNLTVEAGIKYFILGSFTSAFLLFGVLLIYLTVGTTNLNVIAAVLEGVENNQLLFLGVGFILAGLLFKLSAAPLHAWTPDVFDGSMTAITLFIATLPKIGVVYVLINLLYSTFYLFAPFWSQIMLFAGVASLVVGTFGGLYQIKIKRILAFSTINNMGLLLLGLSVSSKETVGVVLFYILTYILLSLGIFALLILIVRGKSKKELVYLSDLQLIRKSHPGLVTLLSLNLFSLIGLPPLAGFISKLYLFNLLIQNKFFFVALLAILLTVITSFYYLRLIKITFFDPVEWNEAQIQGSEVLLLVLYGVALFNLSLLFNVEYVVKIVQTVGLSLLA